ALGYVERVLSHLYIRRRQSYAGERVFERCRSELLGEFVIVANTKVDAQPACDLPCVLGEQGDRLVSECRERITKSLQENAGEAESVCLDSRKRGASVRNGNARRIAAGDE